MIRRVGIAQAMLNNPKILVLDEPTAGLDPNERVRFRNLISELSENRLVLLSTHIVSDVEFIANEIILMKEGKFFYTGSTEVLVGSIDFVLHSIGMSPNVRKKRTYDDLDYDMLEKTLDISAVSFHKMIQAAK